MPCGVKLMTIWYLFVWKILLSQKWSRPSKCASVQTCGSSYHGLPCTFQPCTPPGRALLLNIHQGLSSCQKSTLQIATVRAKAKGCATSSYRASTSKEGSAHSRSETQHQFNNTLAGENSYSYSSIEHQQSPTYQNSSQLQDGARSSLQGIS